MRLLHILNRFTKPKTLGVQGIVFDKNGNVLLVKHTYRSGWHFPGGGVDAGETIRQTLARELREEVGIIIKGSPHLHGVFFNDLYSSRDHIFVFVVREFDGASRNSSNWEISESAFFDVNDLPVDIAPETRDRLRELVEDREPSELWRSDSA
ncbi:MAG: NUDIX domain-containing protein [Pseudomonadota bacterium]